MYKGNGHSLEKSVALWSKSGSPGIRGTGNKNQ